MQLRDLTPDEMPTARALLASCELPTADLDDPTITLAGAFEDTSLLGVVGLQACGDLGLLRSLAVGPAHRDGGVARALCEHIFELAASRSMRTLWLLTTTAEAYFARLGFAPVPRDAVPASIASTREFSSLCPSSARVMCRATRYG